MSPLAFINNLGGPPGFIILLLVLLLFGAKRLPELGRSLGATMREFTKGKEGEDDKLKKEEDKKLPPTA